MMFVFLHQTWKIKSDWTYLDLFFSFFNGVYHGIHHHQATIWDTLPQTNMEPQNGDLKKVKGVIFMFQPLMLQGCNMFWNFFQASYYANPSLLSLKLTWHLKMSHPKRKLIFQPSIFRGYVSFREGKKCLSSSAPGLYLTSHSCFSWCRNLSWWWKRHHAVCYSLEHFKAGTFKDYPIEKENHFESNLHFWGGGSMLIFHGAIEISRWPGGLIVVSFCAGNLAFQKSLIKPSSPIQLLTAIHHRFEA